MMNEVNVNNFMCRFSEKKNYYKIFPIIRDFIYQFCRSDPEEKKYLFIYLLDMIKCYFSYLGYTFTCS